MISRTRQRCNLLCVGLLMLAASVWLAAAEKSKKADAEKPKIPSVDRTVDFRTDVFPVFEQRCLSCHGPEQQMGEFRLDSRSVALEGGLSAPNILPGRGEESPLFQRVAELGELNPMPLVGEKLTPQQIALVKAWIDQGAEWPEDVGVQADQVEKHWAYRKPQRPAPSPVKNTAAIHNPIDNFALARLKEEGLGFAPEASKETLIRRLSLDLRGLPPTLKEVDRFLADNSSDAYEKLVDRILESPHFGEHWARYWLDLARYADTNGYESDEPRSMWAYRDWVISAFNRNLPFDQFTIEQLAGDLLPNPTVDQIVATGFHRNTMVNNEAGAKEDEFYDAAVKDRVDTTATVWLGSTVGCAQCHDHKYDPFKQTEYYQLYAIFNNTADSAIKLSEDIEVFKGDENEIRRREAEVAAVRKVLDTHTPQLAVAQRDWERQTKPKLPRWEDAWEVLEPVTMESTGEAEFTNLPDGSILLSGPAADREVYELTFKTGLQGLTGFRLEALAHESLPDRGPGRSEEGEFVLTGVEAEAWTPQQQERQKELAKNAPVWGPWHTIGPFRVGSRDEAFETEFPPESSYDLTATYENGHLAWIERKHWKNGRVHYLAYIPDDKEENCASYVYRSVEVDRPASVSLSLGSLKGMKVWLNGRLVLSTDSTREIAPDQEALRLDLQAGKNEILLKLSNDTGPYGFYFQPYFGLEKEARVRFAAATADHGGWDNVNLESVLDGKPQTGWSLDAEERAAGGSPYAILQAERVSDSPDGLVVKLRLIHDSPENEKHTLGRFRVSATTLEPDLLAELRQTPARVRETLAQERGQRSEAEAVRLAAHYRSIAPELEEERRTYRKLKADLDAFREEHSTTVLVMRELPEPRETHRQNRGNFLDLAERVNPGVPAVLHPIKEGLSIDRLAFARWLSSKDNPLTARVRVNQIWNQIFGRGLVTTPEDFGTQSDRPTHPQLLDWLATEFMRLDWDTKELLRTIVTSAAYRQSSAVAAEKLEKDPDNRLLSRGARYRVPGEIVRDIALAASGLLSRQVGGPSVFPPQPEAVFADQFIEGGFKDWPASEGADRYRRGLYTFYKRTVVYPTFMTFDAPDRSVCTVARTRSNTPLQALDTLNDPAFFEAAGALAERMLSEADGGRAEQLAHGFRLVLTRRPTEAESDRLLAFHDQMTARYEAAPEDAAKVVQQAFHRRSPKTSNAEMAPWVMVANVVLNLDETITRE